MNYGMPSTRARFRPCLDSSARTLLHRSFEQPCGWKKAHGLPPSGSHTAHRHHVWLNRKWSGITLTLRRFACRASVIRADDRLTSSALTFQIVISCHSINTFLGWNLSTPFVSTLPLTITFAESSLTMPTHPAPTYQHHTVPIGGAPFVHPVLEVNTSSTSSWYAQGTQPASPRSAASSTWSQSSSADGSPSSSPSSSSCFPPSPREAAKAYSKGLHQHTATMWELQRRQIERERLDQQTGSPTQSRSPRNSQSNSAREVPEAASHSRASTLDILLGRSKSRKDQQKTSSRGHHRQSKSIA